MPTTSLGNFASSQPSQSGQLPPSSAPGDESSTKRSAHLPLPGRSRPKNRLDKRSLDYVLRSGLAGGLAGCAAKTIVGPLDRVKILFQASSPQFAKYSGSWFGLATALRDIYHQDGTRGLFRGHSATLLRIFPYAGIKFLAYEQVRAVVIPRREYETPWRRLVSGSAAGVVSVAFTYPLEVIRVRLAFETKQGSRSSLVAICRQIFNERSPAPSLAAVSSSPSPSSPERPAVRSSAPLGTSVPPAAAAERQPRISAKPSSPSSSGLANFYRGFSPTLLGMLPYAGVSFLTHDTAGDILRHPAIARYTTLPAPPSSSSSSSSSSSPTSASSFPRNDDPDKPPPLKYWAELLAGGFAGLVSQTASYPFEVVRRRMQVGGAVGDGHRLRIVETARSIWHEKGARGFFVGLTIGYVKVVPMVATSFLVYERAKLYLGI